MRQTALTYNSTRGDSLSPFRRCPKVKAAQPCRREESLVDHQRLSKGFFGLLLALLVLALPALAFAEGAPHIDGAALSAWWATPFVGMLLSIALCPLIMPNFWHHHFGKVAFFWALAFLVPCAIVYGPSVATYHLLESILEEYLPFIILLFALFTITGGIRVTGSLAGTPQINTLILLLGTLLASWMGTTGAAMLFIRPLMRAIAHRRYRVHTIVFFIFLVANIGGSLTPLGDPPLFLGFLKGVSFFWTTVHVLPETLTLVAILLPLYFIIDMVLYNKEGRPQAENTGEKLGMEGKVNLIFLLGVIGSVLLSGYWKSDQGITIYHVRMGLPGLARDVIMLAMAFFSLKCTSWQIRRNNQFTWEPILEVAKIFAGIFVSMIPAIAILKAGSDGALAGIINMVSQDGQPVNSMYFWLTGALSSFLDNAPTYLVFFNTAGGDAAHLMGDMARTLAAISAGAVFMGANTYIGNAPNFMVRSIAVSGGINMPSFFGYMLWSVVILIPCFILLTFMFFM